MDERDGKSDRQYWMCRVTGLGLTGYGRSRSGTRAAAVIAPHRQVLVSPLSPFSPLGIARSLDLLCAVGLSQARNRWEVRRAVRRTATAVPEPTVHNAEAVGYWVIG